LPTDAARTLRAAAAVFVPGAPHDASPGAADVEADRFLAHYLDLIQPGLGEGAAALLDEVARARFQGRAFASLEVAERVQVLDSIEHHDVEQLRELPSVLGFLAIAAVYGEWTGQDERGRVVRRPLGWDLTGFGGPGRGFRHLLGEP